MRLRDCHNFHDFRKLAKRRLPGPIFNYIDGAADDEVTHRRVPAMRYLVVGCAVDIVEDRARQATLRQLAKVMKVVTVAQAHAQSPNASLTAAGSWHRGSPWPISWFPRRYISRARPATSGSARCRARRGAP